MASIFCTAHYIFAHASLFTALVALVYMFSPVGDPCILQEPCLNGATCNNPSVGEFECVCSPGWAGVICDTGK